MARDTAHAGLIDATVLARAELDSLATSGLTRDEQLTAAGIDAPAAQRLGSEVVAFFVAQRGGDPEQLRHVYLVGLEHGARAARIAP